MDGTSAWKRALTVPKGVVVAALRRVAAVLSAETRLGSGTLVMAVTAAATASSIFFWFQYPYIQRRGPVCMYCTKQRGLALIGGVFFFSHQIFAVAFGHRRLTRPSLAPARL